VTGAVRTRVRDRFASAAFNQRLIAPMVLGAILNPVNSSILAVSLIPIGAAFGAPPSQTAWLVSALYLATSIGQPVAGRLVDIHGPRPVFLAGATLTGIAGVLGTFAPNLALLVVARVILGFGTCAGYPAAMSLIRREAQRTGHDSPAGVLTVLAVSSQTVAVIGPTLGGLLIGIGGWRATLAINIPLALACLVLGLRRLPRTEVDRSKAAQALDYPGIGLFATTLVALLVFLMHPGTGTVWLLGVAIVAGAAFTAFELRARAPFIDLRVLGDNTPLLLTYVRAFLIALVSYAFLYGFTQWLEDGRGLSAPHAGLVLLPVFGIGVIVSTITGRRKEIRTKLLVGQSLQVVACALLLLVEPTSPIWQVLLVTVVLGVPQGLNNLAVQNAVYFQADPNRIGASAGLLRTFFYLGAIAASTASGVFYGKTADTLGLHHIALFVLVASAIGLVITVFDRSLRKVGRAAD
jgi:MFS family permease